MKHNSLLLALKSECEELVKQFQSIMSIDGELNFPDNPFDFFSIGERRFCLSQAFTIVLRHDEWLEKYGSDKAISDAVIEYDDCGITFHYKGKRISTNYDGDWFYFEKWMEGARPTTMEEEPPQQVEEPIPFPPRSFLIDNTVLDLSTKVKSAFQDGEIEVEVSDEYTTQEQSKELMELGMHEDSADMMYYPQFVENLYSIGEGGFIMSKRPRILEHDEKFSNATRYDSDKFKDMCMPCWSGMRIAEILTAISLKILKQVQEDAPNVALSMDVLIQLLKTFKEFGDIDLSNIKIVKKQD